MTRALSGGDGSLDPSDWTLVGKTGESVVVVLGRPRGRRGFFGSYTFLVVFRRLLI